MVAVEKKEQDIGEALFGNDTAVEAFYTMEAQSLREGFLLLTLPALRTSFALLSPSAEESSTTDRERSPLIQ